MIEQGFATLPVPEGTDAPDWPAHVSQFVDDIDKHLVQHVADITERNTRLASAPVGTTAVSTANGTVWNKATSGWVTWWEPLESWRTVTLAAQFSAGTPCQIRRQGKRVHMRGRANHNDSNIPIHGVKVGDVPADCLPLQLVTLVNGISLAGPNETGGARVEVYSATTTSSFGGPGSIIAFLGTISTDVSWVALDGSFWID